MIKNSSKQKAQVKPALALKITSKTLIIALMCILAIQFASAAVDLYSPINNTYSNVTNQTFEFLLSGFNATTCNLIVDSSTVQTINSPIDGFNQFNATVLSGTHTWKVNCSNATEAQESQTRALTIDIASPSIVLFTPSNGTTFSTSNISISFVAIDTQSNEISCNIKLDGQNAYSTIATSAQAMTIGLSAITDGNHNWSVECQDLANNSATSEQRYFTKNTTQIIQPFEITLSNKNIIVGQGGTLTINGPSGSSIQVEACPDISGFVECSIPVNLQNFTNYPYVTSIPFTNYEKKYIIEAYFTAPNRTETKIEKYNVTSDITLNTEVTNNPRKNEPVKLEASATGGILPLTYTWILSNGSTVNSRKTNITYNSPGNFSNLIIVKDQFNNSRNKTVSIEVSNSHSIKFIVRDALTQNPIKDATVSIDSQNKDTDLNGEVQLYIRAGKRDLTILAQNYTAYVSDLNISKDETIIITLNKLGTIKEVAQIELIYPAEGENIIGPTSELSFRVNHKHQTNCSAYINDKDDGFFIDLGSMMINANDNNIQRMGVVDLENTKYWWKVECIDNLGQTGSTVSKTFTVGQGIAEIENTDSMIRYSDMGKSADGSIFAMDNSQPELKETLELLGIKKDAEQKSRIIKNGLRDLEALNYKNLDSSSYEIEKAKIDSKVSEAFNSIPIAFELLDSEGFVDYIQPSELEDLFDEYVQLLESNGTKLNINRKKALAMLNTIQQEAVISTKARNIKLTYKDGTEKELTVVIKQVKVYNITDGTILFEQIPKTIVQSAKEIKNGSNTFKIIKDDPIIGFELNKVAGKDEISLIYYFEKKIDLDSLRDINTALFVEDLSSLQSKSGKFNLIEIFTGMTGFTIKGNHYAVLNWNIALVVLVIAISLFSSMSSKLGGKSGGFGIHSIKYAAYLAKKGDTTHYLRVILSDIKDNLEAGYIEKAVQLYEEVKTAYNDLPTIAKNDVYEQVVECANLISQMQSITNSNEPLQKIVNKIEYAQKTLMESQLSDAINIYKEIEQDYHKLDDKSKETIHIRVVDLVNKINVIAESNKSRYNQ